MTICIGGHNGKTFNHLHGLKQTNSFTNSAEMCVWSATRICERMLWPHRKEILFLGGNKIKWRANGDCLLVLTSVSSRDLEEISTMSSTLNFDQICQKVLKCQYELKRFSSNFMTKFSKLCHSLYCSILYDDICSDVIYSEMHKMELIQKMTWIHNYYD